MAQVEKFRTEMSTGLLDDLLHVDLTDENLFHKILSCMQNHIKYDAATLYLKNSKTNKLKKIVSIKQDVEILTGLHVDLGDGLSGWSAESATPILIADRTKKKSYNPDIDFASFLSVPILKDDSLYGVLNFGSFTTERFSQEDIKLVESSSTLISKFVDYYELTLQLDELQTAQINSTSQLAELQNQKIIGSTVDEISKETAEVIHGINNSLSIIIGNLQCLLIGKNEFNQKSLARLKRIEIAAKKISVSNNRIMNLNTLVNLKSDNKVELIKS